MCTHDGKPALRNLTAAELRAFKGTRIGSQVAAHANAEGSAAESAGIEVVAVDCPPRAEVREGAHEALIHAAVGLAPCRSEVAAYEAMNDRAGAVYRPHSLPAILKLAEF